MNLAISSSNLIIISVYKFQLERTYIIFHRLHRAGGRSIAWDASDYPSGVYFARLEAGGSSQTAKMVLLN